MRILCVGGGSGGHITPIVAVIDQLTSPTYAKRLGAGGVEIRVWCDRKFAAQARQLLAGRPARVDVIAAGKLRRYANLKWWYRWFSPWHIIHTHIPNLIDGFRIMAGFIQSLVKLRLWRPDVVFCKGGYVSLPVGLVAHLYHIPLVIHDSDTVPGLTNRVLAKYADAIGTGAPVENYPAYPRAKTKFIGIPVRAEVRSVTNQQRTKLKRQLVLDVERPLVLAMGGGLGAVAINQAMAANASRLMKLGSEVVLLAGRGRTVELAAQDQLTRRYFHTYQFSDQVTALEQAATVVVTRAGATTMAELAAIGVPTIIIPSPYLAGDHQTKNAAVYQRAGAAVVLNEFAVAKQPELLYQAIAQLLDDEPRRRQLAANLHKFAKPNALGDMVDMILAAAK